LPVFGNEREATRDSAADVPLAHELALDKEAARRQGMPAHHAFEEFGASRAHQTVDAEDLSAPDGKTDVIDSVTPDHPRQADLLRPHDLSPEMMIARRREILRVRTNHLPDDPVDIDVL
jgi:hypothetical protein